MRDDTREGVRDMSEVPRDHAAATRLGYVIGGMYRSYGGGVDTVIGAVHRDDWRGDQVIVCDLDSRIRSHSTPAGSRKPVTT